VTPKNQKKLERGKGGGGKDGVGCGGDLGILYGSQYLWEMNASSLMHRFPGFWPWGGS
jgi:hypothetical protein